MSDADPRPLCPQCGDALPADAPESSCPKCLLRAGFETGGPVPPRDGPTGDAPTPAAMAAHFPDLAISGILGRGGMGVVYRARQPSLDRDVALKVLSPDVTGADGAAFEERFQREARALGRLQHPHIVSVYEFGERDGLYYFLMEHVDGVNLREAMRAGQLTPEQSLAIVPQICDALQYAHDQGVVHRDIKPENVLLTKSGDVKIADFGLAKLVTRTPSDFTLTGKGQLMGTPHYMAPEQIESPGTVDHRADIYSLGVVFYEMLTGELPIGRFAAPSEKSDVSAGIDAVVLRSLEKELDRRYQRVDQMKTAVSSAGTAATAPQEAPRHHPRRYSKLAIWGAIMAPGALVAGLLVAALGLAFAGGGDNEVDGTVAGIAMVAGLLPAVMLLSGVIMSICGWVQIVRSEGRLHGLWLAILGTFLPLLCCVPMASWMTLAGTRVAHDEPELVPFIYPLEDAGEAPQPGPDQPRPAEPPRSGDEGR